MMLQCMASQEPKPPSQLSVVPAWAGLAATPATASTAATSKPKRGPDRPQANAGPAARITRRAALEEAMAILRLLGNESRTTTHQTRAEQPFGQDLNSIGSATSMLGYERTESSEARQPPRLLERATPQRGIGK